MAKYQTRQLREAATLKAKCQRMARDLDELLRDRALPGEMRRHMETLRTSLRRSWKELETGATLEQGRKGLTKQAEAEVKKTVDGVQYPAGDFLVVEDPDKPTTWHLQVRRNGKIDRRLLGAAFAALTKGFRGNKYDGPQKGAAMAKLKKLYDDEDMVMPEEAEEVAEGDYYGEPAVPWGVTSFAQLEAANAANEMAYELRERAGQFSLMVNNIITAGESVPDKPGAMRMLFEEFMLIVQDAFLDAADDAAMMDAEPEEAEPEPTETGEGVIQETDDQPEPLAESYAAEAVLLEEAAPESLAMLDVQIIRPGWGNARDNHYYSREMLARDAGQFVGAKMFETDHRPEEKSTRTWVSTVKEIAGFTSDGAPIARVVVHDPGFAERVRNLSAAGLLEKMECSILANGQAKPFEQAGRKGKVVDSITEVSSVDWVTRAGAGGHAMALAESAAGGLVQKGPDHLVEHEEPEQFIPAQPEPVSTETAEAEPEPVAIHEQEREQVTEAAPDPVLLAETEVDAALAKTNLPPASVLALARESYTDAAVLREAIKAEIRRIKEISGSGRPFALGEAAAVSSVTPTRASIDAALDKINSKYFGR